jgi:uncharacterized DUF497 family protein
MNGATIENPDMRFRRTNPPDELFIARNMPRICASSVTCPRLAGKFPSELVCEYDPNKSAENKRKHGIDFEDAQKLWADPGVVEIPARTSDEARWLLIGKIDQKHWSAIITGRGENTRLISVRRSREEEVALYESEDI